MSIVSQGFVKLEAWRELAGSRLAAQLDESDENIGLNGFESKDLDSFATLAVSTVAKSLGLKYNAFDEFLETAKTVPEYQSWNFVTLCFARQPTRLALVTGPVELAKNDVVVVVGKVFEISSRGVVFNSVLHVEQPENCVFIEKQMSRDVRPYKVALKLDLLHFSNEISARVEKVNCFKDHTLQPSEQVASHIAQTYGKDRKSMRSLFGYKNNYSNTFLEFDDPQMDYVHLDIDLWPYLASVGPESTVGEVAAAQASSSVLSPFLAKFHEWKSAQSVAKVKFLEKVFVALDSLVFVYFMSHSNSPDVMKEFVPRVVQMTGRQVELLHILEVKALYPESYNLVRNGSRVLISLPNADLGHDFTERLALRRKIFSAAVDEFCRDTKDHVVLETSANAIFDTLPNVARESRHKVLKAGRTVQVQRVTKPSSSSNGSNGSKNGKNGKNGKKLSLLERIKLKEAEKRAMVHEQGQKSAKETDNLLAVFEIMFNLHPGEGYKSFPESQIVRKIQDSGRGFSSAECQNALQRLSRLLGNDILQLVGFKGDSGSGSELVVVKFCFYNRRDEILRLLKEKD